MNQLLTQTEFATRRGVGKSAVSNWKRAGLLVFGEGDGGRLLVDVVRTEARLNAKIDPGRGRPTTAVPVETVGDGGGDELPLGEGSKNAAKLRTEVLEEDLRFKRMKNAEGARELVASMEQERRASELGRMARERVQAELRSLAERLAAERDPRAIMTLCDGAIDTAFIALADAVENGALMRDDDGEDNLPEAA